MEARAKDRSLLRHHPGATLTPAAVSALEGYDWPGNVRELRNVLTRAVVLNGEAIDILLGEKPDPQIGCET